MDLKRGKGLLGILIFSGILMLFLAWAYSGFPLVWNDFQFPPQIEKVRAATSTITINDCFIDDGSTNSACFTAWTIDGGTAFPVSKNSHADAPLSTISVSNVSSATFFYDHGPSVVSGTWQIFVTDTRDGTTICSVDPAVESTPEITSSFSCNSITPTQLSNGVWVRVVGETDKSPEDVVIDYLRLQVVYNAAPNTPSNVSPSNGSTSVAVNPGLSASSYSDPESDTHSDTEWRIDDDSGFGTPVWTRTAGTGEESTTVNTTNGTFANELSGETALAQDTQYHWQVRYNDGTSWSSWSSSTVFTTGGTTYNQSGYRWFANQNSTDVGSALAATNTLATLSSTGEAFRLRNLLHISDIDLSQSGQDFKLQFASKGGGSCASPSGSYADLKPLESWVELSPTGTPPSARNGHSAVWDTSSSTMYVFGGDNLTNDLWEFDPGANTWTELSPTGGPPDGRKWHTSVWDDANNVMYIFGGATTTNQNDLWEFDPGANTWTELSPTGTPPSARSFSTSAWDDLNNVMYVFGGNDGGFKNDLWEFDPTANTWTQITPTGGPPSTRHGATAVWDSTNNVMYVFGGYNGSWKNDLWEFDPTANTWTQITPTGGPPFVRFLHSASWDLTNDIMYVFGGATSTVNTTQNDLWEFDPGANTWTETFPNGGPPENRYIHTSVWNTSSSTLYVFGGTTPSGDVNDLWEFDSNSNPGAIAYYKNSVSDGSALTDNANDPTHNSDTINNQTYEEINNFTNSQSAISAGEDGMWDFALVDNGAPANTTYCFRVVKSDDTTLGTYDQYPEITTAAAVAAPPSASAVSIDSGATSVTLIENTTTTVNCSATVTDNNGYTDITSVRADFYRTTRGTSSALDNNDHYKVEGDSECVPSGGSGTTENYSCDIDVWYYADPTDAGSPQPGDDWTCTISPSDSSGTGTTAFDTIEIDSLLALSAPTSLIFPDTDPGNNTGAFNATTTIINTGNRNMDPQLEGSSLTKGADTIAVGNIEYSSTTFTYNSGVDLTAVATYLDLLLPQRTNGEISDEISWGIGIPNGSASGIYQGVATITANSAI